ncbi:hypothetical protein J1N35_042283 [Gossypium stocksii]|uniref:Uncharacterized protein n=1 Tax=Gossypium stocksii TaxID=47602 RepID=A0A9D3ZJF4_9ROSI|nr:hypothetical protein J1N35_042283 [Gossypium stocksii]
MAEIGNDILAAQHAAGWDVDTPLPNVFTVAVGARRFRVHCRPHGGRYRIYGDEWRGFVNSNLGVVVTLHAREEGEDFHSLEVRR